MSIYNVSRQLLPTAKLNGEQHVLQPGQIVQGKILNLYPNNKAQIQLGSSKMIAQLEASLTTAGKYHFQVQATGDVTHLKVLGEQSQSGRHTNVQQLLQLLGLKATKPAVMLMQKLIQEKIPFGRDQMAKSLQLLEGAKNKLQAQLVLKEMIVRKLPLTATVFNALYAVETSEFSEQVKSLLQQLKEDINKTPLHRDLSYQLRQMTEPALNNKGALVKHIITEVTNNNRHFFNLLKATGLIEKTVDFVSWKSQWEAFARKNSLTPLNVSNQKVTALELPLRMNETLVRETIAQMMDNKANISRVAENIILKFGNAMEKATANNTTLDKQEFALFKQQIMLKVMPLIPIMQQAALIDTLQNNPPKLQQLLTTLQTLASELTNLHSEQFLMNIKQGETINMTPKEQLLAQFRQVLLFTGLTHENEVKRDVIQQQSTTVKSMLIKMVQQHGGTTQERAQQLLNFINGLQLQSVNETSNLIQASLQLPGEKLALNSDIHMDVEGEKTEKGMINPDHCRILFYLDLTNLQKTIIDVHIQKRSVAVTIFNDQERLQKDSLFLQPMLKEGLAALNYHLTTVTVKPLQQIDRPKKKVPTQAHQSTYQGVDYRV